MQNMQKNMQKYMQNMQNMQIIKPTCKICTAQSQWRPRATMSLPNSETKPALTAGPYGRTSGGLRRSLAGSASHRRD